MLFLSNSKIHISQANMTIYMYQFIRTVDDEELEQFMYQCSYCNMVQLEVLLQSTRKIDLQSIGTSHGLEVMDWGLWDDKVHGMWPAVSYGQPKS